jgi:hypothetical protein
MTQAQNNLQSGHFSVNRILASDKATGGGE